MREITHEERKEMYNHFINYTSTGVTEHGMDEMLQQWEDSKNTILKDLFKDELKFTIDAGKAPSLANTFLSGGHVANSSYRKCMEKSNDLIQYFDALFNLHNETIYLPRCGRTTLIKYRIFTNLPSICLSEVVDNKTSVEYYIKIASLEGEEITNFRVQKGSKVMKMFINVANFLRVNKNVLHSETNNQEDLLVQAIEEAIRKLDIALSDLRGMTKNNMKVTLSIEPMDYLTVSGPDFDWSSCFAPTGEYAGCVMPLMASSNTVIAYVKGSKDLRTKNWRAYVTITEDGFIVGRQYPYSNIRAVEAIEEYFTSLFKEKYGTVLCKAKFSDSFARATVNCIYNDYGAPLTGEAYIRNTEDSDVIYFEIDSEYSICPNCGQEDYREYGDRREIVCEECDPRATCEDCGDREDNLIDIGNGTLVCEHCISDNYMYCETCQSYVHYDYYNSDYEMCDSCYEDLPECDICEERDHGDNMATLSNGLSVCMRCQDDVYMCEDCGGIFLRDEDVIELERKVNIKGVDYIKCSGCLEEIIEKLKEEEEEEEQNGSTKDKRERYC